jgi:cyclophilin family peptidyl-prolyl cis-trans isomerase
VCSDLDVLDRVVIGLYGDVAPTTVQNFLALVTAPQGQGFKGTGARRTPRREP